MNTNSVFSLLIGSLFLLSFEGVIAAPQLSADTQVSSAGYYQLSWDGDGNSQFILEESVNPDFTQATTLYEGPDTASLISGRSNGTYYYRIRLAGSDPQMSDSWSNIASIEVTHHPLSRAFMFFGIGAVVFIATLVVVVLGSKIHKQ